MKLSGCWVGRVVKRRDMETVSDTGVGYIVGLVSNRPFAPLSDGAEVIPLVKFVGREEPISIHHGNIEPYKD